MTSTDPTSATERKRKNKKIIKWLVIPSFALLAITACAVGAGGNSDDSDAAAVAAWPSLFDLRESGPVAETGRFSDLVRVVNDCEARLEAQNRYADIDRGHIDVVEVPTMFRQDIDDDAMAGGQIRVAVLDAARTPDNAGPVGYVTCTVSAWDGEVLADLTLFGKHGE